MPSATAGHRIMNVQVETSVAEKLDEISRRTHVPKSVIIKMGIERVVDDIFAGRITLGISFGPAQPSTNTPPPPPVANPTFQIGDPTGQNR